MTPTLGWARLALVSALWLGACFLVRARYVQAEQLVEFCAAQPEALVCVFRELMGKAMHFKVLGHASLALALSALLLPGRAGRWLAWPALLAAGAALVFYNAGTGAPAAVLALLRVARVGR